MPKRLKITYSGFFFTLVLGTLNHFFYQWSGGNILVGVFSAVNESTWEHLKLLVMPMLLFGVLECILLCGETRNFIPVRVASIWLGMAVIVTSFYTYKGIIGRNFLWADIGTFVLGAAAAYWFATRLMGTNRMTGKTAQIAGWLALAILIASFILFTFYPPRIGLFAVPGEA